MVVDALLRHGAEVKAASRALALAPDSVRTAVLIDAADELLRHEATILATNEREVQAFTGAAAARDRLALSPARLKTMAETLRAVAELPDPLYVTSDARVRPNGLRVSRLRVPLGVIGVIYENRPNVTTDVAGLAVRSGNAAFLRGSASAQATNAQLVALFRAALERHGLPADGVALVEDPSHETAARFMGLVGVIDCLIPRGGPALVAAVREHARVPVVLDGDGNCHVYVDASADLTKAVAIVANAKCSRPGVCNAAETLLVHRDIAAAFLPAAAAALDGVELRADDRARAFLPRAVPVTDLDFATEFLDLTLAVGVVDDLDGAIGHVRRFSSGHSEAIVAEDHSAIARWIREVDAAAVVVNASTRFVDGGELGLGGEVGVSTQKLHARGPMGLEDLTCRKWVVEGEGQTR